MQYKFTQVNVFSPDPKRGNPLAIVHCDTLSTEDMQQIASWTNVSETVFISPPSDSSARYAMRIFSPIEELCFGGHPTLGAAHLYLEGNGDGDLVQQCELGLVNVSKRDGIIYFKVPGVEVLPLESHELEVALDVCGLDRSQVEAPVLLKSGPAFSVLLLKSYDELVAVQPNWAPITRNIGLAAIRRDGDLEVRMFMNSGAEDPICGSLNGALGYWLIGEGRLPASYRARQGQCIGRAGQVFVETREDGLWCGGHVQTVIRGTIELGES